MLSNDSMAMLLKQLVEEMKEDEANAQAIEDDVYREAYRAGLQVNRVALEMALERCGVERPKLFDITPENK